LLLSIPASMAKLVTRANSVMARIALLLSPAAAGLKV
jgi:hypothetical protein